MKISFLISSFRGGGKERQLLYLVKHLSQNNWRVQLVVLNEEVFYREISALPIEFVIVDRKKNGIRTIGILNRKLRLFSPTILNTWDIISHIYSLPFIFFKKPKVLNSSIRYGGMIKKTRASSLMQRISLATSDLIVSNSKAGLVAESLLACNKAVVIRNGIDFSELYKPQTGRMGQLEATLHKFETCILMVGRFYPAKDYSNFIRAAKIVIRTNPNTGFFCVGEGPNRGKAEEEAGALLNKNIFFLGERRDVHSIVHAFDIGVMLNNTNGHAEGISNAIMEYMAAQLPVIATNAGGNSELVRVQKSGYLVPPFNPEVVAEKLLFLIENESIRHAMGKLGQEIIKNEFSLEKMVSSYIKLYKNFPK